MPRFFISKFLTLLLCSLLLQFCTSCGGGGGGGGDSSSESFTIDACRSIGLRLINGESCFRGPKSATPIVRIRSVSLTGEVALCTGALITPSAVLTAGHCFLDPSSAVFVDALNSSQAAKRVRVHPSFLLDLDALAAFSDVAVVEVSEPFSLPVFPLLTSRPPKSAEEAVVAGVGQTEDDSSGLLEAGNTRISDVTTNHLFTDFDGSGSNPCFGDSGGPLLVEEGGTLAIVGVVSSGNPDYQDCGAGDRVLYTNIQNDAILSFVLSAVSGVQTK